MVTSEVEQRQRLVTAGYGRHGSQWVIFHRSKQGNRCKSQETADIIHLITRAGQDTLPKKSVFLRGMTSLQMHIAAETHGGVGWGGGGGSADSLQRYFNSTQ